MWQLTIEDDEGGRTLLPLARSEYKLGRDESNGIRLTERNISRRHATLVEGEGGWVIVDHDSYNGCYVNGDRVVERTRLRDNDVLQVGDYRIFVNEDLAARPSGAQAVPPPSEKLPTPVAEQPNRLVLLTSPEPGRVFVLEGADVFVIGREADCAVSVNHPSVSRTHADIRALGAGRLEILDRGSSNGVKVNGTELRRALLEGGDLIELGEVKFRFLEHGQVVRLGADSTQQMASLLATRPAVFSVRPGAKKSKTPLLVGLGVVGVLAVGLAVALVAAPADKGPAASASSAATPEDVGRAALDEAKKSAAAGDYEGAVKQLARIPDGSPAKHDPDVARLYGLWADGLFRAADEATEPSEKKDAWTKIAGSPGVDNDRRRKASDLLTKLTEGSAKPDATKTIDLDTPSTVAKKDPPVADPTAKPDATKPDATKPDATKPDATKPDATKPDKPKPEGAKADDDVTSKAGEARLRKQLEGKVFSGKGTPDEIKMLRAICKHQGDSACASRAGAMLK